MQEVFRNIESIQIFDSRKSRYSFNAVMGQVEDLQVVEPVKILDFRNDVIVQVDTNKIFER